MQFSKVSYLLAALASLVQADNMVTFKSLDDVDRTVYFTPNAGLQWLDPVRVPAGQDVDVPFPHGWIGNWYAVQQGKVNKPGMLGEVAFNGWNGLNYFDVSAIVDATDMDNVSEMYPFDEPSTPKSGCGLKNPFPCNEAYYMPDDVQTKVTTQTHLVCTLSKNNWAGASARDVPEAEHSESVARNFVLGKF